MTDPPIEIDFGDQTKWEESLVNNQEALFDEPPLTLPLQITPPTAPRRRTVRDVKPKEDLL